MPCTYAVKRTQKHTDCPLKALLDVVDGTPGVRIENSLVEDNVGEDLLEPATNTNKLSYYIDIIYITTYVTT